MRIEGFELSPQQSRLWSVAARLLEGDGAEVAARWPAQLWAYAVISLPGQVDLDRLERALGEVVARHEILRTVFRSAPGMRTAVQVVLPAAAPAGVTRAAATPVADLLATARRPADVGGRPALRCLLGEAPDGGRRLVLSVPVLCADQLSMQRLVTELAAAYQGVAGPAADEVVQYADYAQWQCDLDRAAGAAVDAAAAGNAAAAGEAAGSPAGRPVTTPYALALPPQIPPAAGEPAATDAGAYRFWLSDADRDLATATAAGLGVDLPVFLLACWRVLLWTMAAEPGEVSCWLAVDGRDGPGLATAVGLFERRLPVTGPVTGGQRLIEVVAATAAVVAGFAGGQLPVAAIPPPPATAVGFRFVRQAGDCGPFALSAAGGDTDLLPLDLTVADGGGRLAGSLRHDPRRFPTSAVRELAERFPALVRAALADPAQRVGGLDVCTEQERAALVLGRNRTGRRPPASGRGNGYQRFADQAVRRPGATALVWRDRPVSYGALRDRVEQLHRALRDAGVRPGSRVGICHRTSPDLVASVLAIWRLGAAYLAVNPADPPDRVAGILGRAGCQYVLLDELELARALAQRGCPARSLRPADLPAGQPDPAGPAAGTGPAGRGGGSVGPGGEVPAGLAYLAHTSGTTGPPNLVSAGHRGLANYFDHLTSTAGLGEADVVLQLAPFGFDAWLRDTIAPLTAGAAVVLVDEDRRRDSGALLADIARHGVTRLLHCVPSQLRDLVAGGGSSAGAGPAQPGPLRSVLSSGEPLRYDDIRAVRARFGQHVEVVNQYGPTECTLTSTYHRVQPSEGENGSATVPLGEPIGNARVYLLNDGLRPVPRGVVGEIYIGGAGVCYGYEREPALTAARFLPDPFAPEPGGRLYRTGDLARWCPGDRLEFLGRRDDQLKLRGIRVELGEVEATLAGHPTVDAAAVVAARADERQPESQLVGFVVQQEPGTPVKELRQWLADRLPGHLLPSLLVPRAVLPLTRHGKRDRQRLISEAAAELSSYSGSAGYVAPRTDREQRIVDIFARTLNRERVGIHDSFFQLGGHSLLATRAAYEVSTGLGVALPLRAIFEHPTPAELAEVAAALPRATAGEPAPGDRDESVATDAEEGAPATHPLSFAQHSVWLADALEPAGSGHNVQLLADVSGGVDEGLLRQALSVLARRHPGLRTTFPLVDDQPVQQIHPTGQVELAVTRVSGAAAEAELRAAAARDLRAPFRIDVEHPWRCRLVRFTDQHAVLVITAHHIVIDEWSVGVLLHELVTVYDALATGRPPEPPGPPVAYHEYAAWQRRWLTDDRLASQLDYWRGALAGAPTELPLPYDRPRPAEPALPAGRVSRSLPQPLIEAVGRLAERHRGTLFMAALAAFKVLLWHVCGARDLVVGSPVANRTRPEAERVVGYLANIMVLRTVIAGDPSFDELLEQVRQTALGAYAHQDLPFPKLVQELKPGRARHRMPFASVWFVLHNTPAPDLAGAQIQLALRPRDAHTARFDLNLALTETGSGIDAALEYDAEVFELASGQRLLDRYVALLESVVERPAARLSELGQELERLDREERQVESQQRQQARQRSFGSFRATAASPVRVSGEELMRVGQLPDAERLPLLLEPGAGQLELTEWVAGHREWLNNQLRTAAGVLFRGFGVDSVAGFQEVVAAYSPQLLDYYERSTPRERVSGKVYTSTEYPPERHIPLHSESAYSYRWPRTLWFCCLQPASHGGATPLADTRVLLAALEQGLREQFTKRRVMYTRNYHDGFDIPWQVAFQTEDKGAVADYCRQVGMEYEWRRNGVLRTWQVLDAIVTHPDTGEQLWFNQVHAYHISSLDDEMQAAVRGTFADDDLPRNVCYGDGTPISGDELAHISQVYQQATVSFPWRTGDVLLLDNMLTAHGRAPYAGSRRVVVAMTDPCDRAMLAGGHANGGGVSGGGLSGDHGVTR